MPCLMKVSHNIQVTKQASQRCLSQAARQGTSRQLFLSSSHKLLGQASAKMLKCHASHKSVTPQVLLFSAFFSLPPPGHKAEGTVSHYIQGVFKATQAACRKGMPPSSRLSLFQPFQVRAFSSTKLQASQSRIQCFSQHIFLSSFQLFQQGAAVACLTDGSARASASLS